MTPVTLMALTALLLSPFLGTAYGLGLDLGDEGDADDERAIIVAAASNGTLFGLNLSQLLPLLALAAAALLPLLCLCALSALLLWHLLESKDDGYGHSGYGASYSEYQRAFGLGDLDWEKLSIVDWVEMGEETFRKFEPSNLSCQTRLVCELHQNAAKFGPLANGVVQVFGYLKYLDLLNIPVMLKELLAEYRDAADKGSYLTKDCGDIYPDCQFSVNQLYDKFIGTEVK